MGIFGSNKAYDMPPGDPKEWTPLNVKHWIKHIGMAKHKTPFRVLNGAQLLALKEQDIQMMCKQELDSKYVYRMLLRLKGEPEKASAGPAASAAAKERAVQYLFQWAGEDASMSEFKEFLDGAGTVTTGLMAACDKMPNNSVGVIVGLVFKIYKSSRDAQVNIYNCRILRYLCVDILRGLHSAGGDRLMQVPHAQFVEIQNELEKALMLVRSCSKPGWLVRMAYAGRIDEEFEAIHEALVEVLQACGMDDLYGHAKLPPRGEYTDCCVALQAALQAQHSDIRGALSKFAETGQGYDAIRNALSCDDEGLRTEMNYIAPALAVIDKMLPTSAPARPSTPPPVTIPAAPRTPPRTTDEDIPPAPTPTEEPVTFMPHSAPSMYSSEDTPPSKYRSADSTPPKHMGEDLVPRQQDSAAERAMMLEQEQGSEGASSRAAGAKDNTRRPQNIYEIFLAFCNYGTRQETVEMDGSHFSKFCRDTHLIGKDFTSTEVDLIFARVKPKGQRRIVYQEFVEALTLIAEKKRIPLKQLTDNVLSTDGPATTATRATYNRLHDDKNTYTGVYARGGPTNVDNRISLDKMVMRTDPKEFSTPRLVMSARSGGLTPRVAPRKAMTPRAPPPSADVSRTSSRRISYAGAHETRTPRATSNTSFDMKVTPRSNPPLSARAAPSMTSSPGSAPRMVRNMVTTPRSGLQSGLPRPLTAPADGRAFAEVPWQGDPDAQGELLRVYGSFAAFGSHHGKAASSPDEADMENKQFVKLIKDAGLTGGDLNVTRLDIIFSKVKGKGLRKINFREFERALVLLAEAGSYSLSQVYNAIVTTAGPQLNQVTTPEFVKYHDNKALYTGVYARGGPTNIDKRITLDKMVTRTDDVYVNSRTPRFVA